MTDEQMDDLSQQVDTAALGGHVTIKAADLDHLLDEAMNAQRLRAQVAEFRAENDALKGKFLSLRKDLRNEGTPEATPTP